MRKTIKIIIMCFITVLFFAYSYIDTNIRNEDMVIQITDRSTKSKCKSKTTAGISSIICPNINYYKSMTPCYKEENNKVEEEILIGWTTSNLNIRDNSSIKSNIVDTIPFNTCVQYIKENEEWGKIINDSKELYINLEFIETKQCDYIEYSVPNNNGFKSYMSYKTIKSKSSSQYLIQNCYAYTGNYGIRQVRNRYCVAIGTAFNAKVGTYVDLILSNGEVINCIVSDIKADIHTDAYNIATRHNGCVSEFIVDEQYLPYVIHNQNSTGSGDISDCNDMWSGKVTNIKVYNKNLFDE